MVKPLTMAQAEYVAQLLYGGGRADEGQRIGLVRRKRKAANGLFVVGYIIVGDRSHVTGTSNVDWESAFYNAMRVGAGLTGTQAEADAAWIKQVGDAIDQAQGDSK